MTSKFTFILVFFLSPIFLQWCHSNEDVFDYIFGDDGDDMFSISKPSPTENPPAKESNKAPVQEFVKQPLAEPIKEPINEPSKKPIKEPSKEPVKELKQDVTQQPLKETGQGSVNKPTKEGTGFTPLGDFLKLGLPFQELAKESPVKLTTEDGKDGPLGQFLNVAQPPEKSKKKKRKRKKKNRSSNPVSPTTESNEDNDYQYEGQEGLRKHWKDVQDYTVNQVSAMAGNVGLAWGGLVTNAATQTLKRTSKFVDSSTRALNNVLSRIQNFGNSGMHFMARGINVVGRNASDGLESLSDMLDRVVANITKKRRRRRKKKVPPFDETLDV